MDLRLLKYFYVLAEELHFGKAAKRLYISQPPLSRQIKSFEEELGVKLFNRDKRNVELTIHGQYLREEAQKLFQHIELIKTHLKLLDEGVIGQLRSGYVVSAMHSILPRILLELKNNYHKIDIVLQELNNDAQIKALKDGSIDIGFIRTPLHVDEVSTHPIFVETFSLVLSKNHPLSSSAKVSLRDLADEPFIGFCHTCALPVRNMIMGICNKEGFLPNIVHQTNQINTIIRLVEANFGYSILPSSVKEAYKLNVNFYELADYPERTEISLAYNPKRINPISKRVIDFVLHKYHQADTLLQK